MSIQGISSSAYLFLQPPEAVTRVRRSTSTIAQVLDQVKLGNEVPTADTVSLRFTTLERAHSRLRETSSALETVQARKAVVMTVEQSLGRIGSELDQIEMLLEDIEEGEYSESQLADAQLIIESRIARIDDIAGSTKYAGGELLRGETVRVMSDPVTEEGFDVYYPKIDSESLGLESIDVVSSAIDANIEIATAASEALSSAAVDVESEIEFIDTVFSENITGLEEAFESLRSSELLGAAEETRWVTSSGGGIPGGGNLGKLIPAARLVSVLSNLNLDPEVVSSLLS